MARGVNAAWNFCNELQRSEFEIEQTFKPAGVEYAPKFYSGFDFNKAAVGMAARFGIYNGSLNATCEQYAKSRKQCKRRWLRWRSNRKSSAGYP